ncbi:MAG: hypothetical protein H0V59_04985 [Nocardioidaceae bacterium]|nr:hypothetical protein [Nocardioidaceae bacterium]
MTPTTLPKSGVVHFTLDKFLRHSKRWHTVFIPDNVRAMAGDISNDQKLEVIR